MRTELGQGAVRTAERSWVRAADWETLQSLCNCRPKAKQREGACTFRLASLVYAFRDRSYFLLFAFQYILC